MKYILGFLFALFIILFVVGFTQSQNVASGQINSVAKLVGSISVVPERDLMFGELEYQETTISTNNPNSGMFNVNMGPGRPEVLLTFDVPVKLEFEGNGPGLIIEGYKYVIEGQNTTISEGDDLPGTSISVDLADYNRDAYIFIGATVKPTQDNLVGNYLGKITLTAEIN